MELQAKFKCQFCGKEEIVSIKGNDIKDIENPLFQLRIPCSTGEFEESVSVTKVEICKDCMERLLEDMVKAGYSIYDWYGLTIKTPMNKVKAGGKNE